MMTLSHEVQRLRGMLISTGHRCVFIANRAPVAQKRVHHPTHNTAIVAVAVAVVHLSGIHEFNRAKVTVLVDTTDTTVVCKVCDKP